MNNEYLPVSWSKAKYSGGSGCNGGNGGSGGDGAAAGSLILAGSPNIEAINHRLKANGGSPGSGGVEASGIRCRRHFTGYRRFYKLCSCSCRFCDGHEEFGGYGYTNNDEDCPGHTGLNGNPGMNWDP